MKQLINMNFSKEAKVNAENLIRKHRKIEGVIESKKLDMPISMTANYSGDKVQSSNGFHSETERVALLKNHIQDLAKTKQKLDFIYDSLTPVQKEIWKQRYILDFFDTDVYTDLDIPRRSYYRMKKEIIALVIDAFDLAE